MHQIDMDSVAMDTQNISSKAGSIILQIAEKVFAEDFTLLGSLDPHMKFPEIWSKICKNVKENSSSRENSNTWNPTYRIGPEIVKFNQKKYVGTFDFKDGDQEICSKDNFSTISANTCVFKGKWQYEVVLASKGVMQLGWATIKCEFSKENGVGDTNDSYAYDGNRQRKWNVATEKYGEIWHVGDVISTTIDLDKGKISYLRNGRSLGTAFHSVRTGWQMSYFPAMSLAIDQMLSVNFGGRPFIFPQSGYQPLQKPPFELLFMARKFLFWFNRVVDLTVHGCEVENDKNESISIALLVIAKHIGSYLIQLLHNLFIMEEVLIPYLVDLSDSIVTESEKSPVEDCLSVRKSKCFFRYLMTTSEEDSVKIFLDNLIMCLQRKFTAISLNIDYCNQKSCYRILQLLFSDSAARKFCLKNILFKRNSHYRFVTFSAIHCFDLVNFKKSLPVEFWSTKNGYFCQGDRKAFENTLNSIKAAVQELQDLHISVLRLLFTPDDAPSYESSSRVIFLSKLRSFIKERLSGSRLSSTSFIPSSTILWFCRFCFALFRRLWKEEIEEDLSFSTIPPSLFFDGEIDYFDSQRIGGLDSHLRKKYAEERAQAMKESKELKRMLYPLEYPTTCSNDTMTNQNLPSTSGAVLGELLPTEVKNSMDTTVKRVDVRGTRVCKASREELRTSLIHLLDGVALMYHHKGYKHMDKVVALTDSYFDNVQYLKELLYKKEHYNADEDFSRHVASELNRSIDIMNNYLRDEICTQAWNLSTTFSLENVEASITFLKLILGALTNASNKGGLFSFVPEFYLEVLLKLCKDLKCLVLCNQDDENCTDTSWTFCLPSGFSLPTSLSEEYESLLKSVAEFLARHFCDSRIVYCNSRDSLIQSLAKMVCHKTGLKALESMTYESRGQMVRNLLQPYENRAWAQNNWILVRFWKGNGYAFRFSKSPHLDSRLGPKPAHCEIPNIILSSAPLVSESFLSIVADLLTKKEVSTPFVNSLLNQLNWVFSEFIGMLQEIQNASNRPERVFIDSRQLRICATCFDLALGLLRVLEMVVCRAPAVFLHSDSCDSKPLLTRLCQLLCQVLNRVNINSGCFSHVVKLEIPGLETIHYFPILTAVVGIICQLLKNDIYGEQDTTLGNSASKFLLGEASFQISCLYDLLGGQIDSSHPSQTSPCSMDVDDITSTPSCSKQELEGCTTLSSELRSKNDPFNERGCANVLKRDSSKFRHIFCLRNYPSDVASYEIDKLVSVIRHLEKMIQTKESTQLQETSSVRVEDSESVCTICYATVSDAVFVPCGHTSCSTCITHYLMNRCACFFCKSPINQVKDINGKIFYTKSSST